LPEAVRALSPDRALGRLVGSSPLRRLTDWREATQAALDVPVGAELRARGLGAAALRLLQANNSYGDTLDETSLLNPLYVQSNIAEIMKTPGPVLNVAGGNQRLPEARARALRGDVLLGRRATEVDAGPLGWACAAPTARCTAPATPCARCRCRPCAG